MIQNGERHLLSNIIIMIPEVTILRIAESPPFLRTVLFCSSVFMWVYVRRILETFPRTMSANNTTVTKVFSENCFDMFAKAPIALSAHLESSA